MMSDRGFEAIMVHTHAVTEYQANGATGGLYIDVLVYHDAKLPIMFRPYQLMAMTGERYPAAVSSRQINDARWAAAGAIAAERLRLRSWLLEVL